MISTDPEPDRTSPARRAPGRTARQPRAQISLDWSRAAGRQYSSLEGAPARIALNALAKRAVRQTLLQAPFKLELPAEISDSPDEIVFAVDVSFVSDEEIQELNASHRGKNKPTDVLSFSQLEGEMMPFGGDEILLGDVIVSVETAVRQARELKHSLEHEFAFLLAHGVLHLCGYDHDTSSKRRAMWKQQDEIVLSLNLP